MNFTKVFFVALVASIALSPLAVFAKVRSQAISNGYLRFGERALANVQRSMAPKILKQARVFAGVEERAPVEARLFDASADATCQAVKSCSACITTAGCVWAIGFGLVGEETNPTGFGSFGVCVSGTDAGPADRTGDTSGLELLGIDIFSGNTDSYAYWSTSRTCDKTYRVVQIDAVTLSTAVGFAQRSESQVDSTFGRVYPTSTFQKIGEMTDPKQQAAAILDLVAGMFSGIRLYMLNIFAEGGVATVDSADDVARAGFGVFYFGIDMGEFMKAVFAAIQKAQESGGNGDDFNALNLGAKAVMFFVFFDKLSTYTYAATTPLGPTTTTMASLPITGLAVTESPTTTQGTCPGLACVTVYNYHMKGDLGTSGPNFDMSCYMATDTFTNQGNTIDPTTFECDFIVTGLTTTNAGGANYGVGINAVIVALDVNLLSANSGRASNGNINVGNADFTIVATAKIGSWTSSTSANVMFVEDKDCTGVSWLNSDFKANLATEFGGSASALCAYYSFDNNSPASIYWDPAGAVNDEKANAAVNSKLASSAAGITPLIALVLAALALVLAL